MKNLEFLVDKFIAHRGIHYTFLENSISAFKLAIDKNYPIELDVRLTKDEYLVVFHDETLKRLFDKNLKIDELTLKEINEYYNIPTLDFVLKLVNGRVAILIELKENKKRRILEKKLVNLLDNYNGKFAVMSFYYSSILWFKRVRPNYIRGFLIHSLIPGNFIYSLIYKKNLYYLLKPDFIGTNLSSLKTDRIKLLRKKYLILGYTLKKDTDYQKYQNYADNFICDFSHK